MPTLLLIGAKDDISSPAACRHDGRGRARPQRADPDRNLSRRPARLRSFQSAVMRLVAAPMLAVYEEPGHIGTDAEARANSQKRVAEWLSR